MDCCEFLHRKIYCRYTFIDVSNWPFFSDLVSVQNVHIVEGKKRKKKTNYKYLMEIAGLQYRNSLFTDSSRHRLKTNQKLASLLIRVDEDGRCCIPAGTVTTLTAAGVGLTGFVKCLATVLNTRLGVEGRERRLGLVSSSSSSFPL